MVTIINTLGFTILPSLFEFFIVCVVVFTSFGGFWYECCSLSRVIVDYPMQRFSLLIFLTIISYAAFTFTIAEWRSKFRKESNDKENESNNAALDRYTQRCKFFILIYIYVCYLQFQSVKL